VVSEWGTPDLIHAHSLFWAGYAAAALRESYGIPYVVTEHLGIFGLSNEAARPYISPWHRSFLSKAVNDAERIIMVGSKMAAQIEPLRKSEVPLELIPNGVDTDYFVPSNSAAERDFTFVFVGNLLREKGVYNLIAAFVALRQRSQSIRLIVVGDGPERSGLARAVDEAGVSGAVEFTGQVGRDAVRASLARGRVFVLPSDWEGLPVSVLEAMSMGLPVIATDGSPPELFPLWAGLRIPIRDLGALTDAMSTAMQNHSDFDCTRIRAFAIAQYDFRAVAERIVDVYRHCLEAPRVR
jgi:glycosyltransferase involved in cell wall biosynthesis